MARRIFAFLCVVTLASCASIQTENDLLNSVRQDCLESNTLSCIKYSIFNLIGNTLDQPDTVKVIDGVTVVKSKEESDVKGAPRALGSDATIESVLIEKVKNFFESRSLEFEISGRSVGDAFQGIGNSLQNTYQEYLKFSEEEDAKDLVDEGRKKKKKLKKLKFIKFLIIKKIAFLKAIFFKLFAVGLLFATFKALAVSIIALALTLIQLGQKIGLAGSFLGIFKKPSPLLAGKHGGWGAGLEDHSGLHGGLELGHHEIQHSGWGRTSQENTNTPYRGYADKFGKQ